MLSLLENPDVTSEEREVAEKHVMEAVEKFGVWIGHGDLLTVKMVMEAKMSMKGSATAFERLEFINGPFRLQLLHMKMKKISQDFSACMPLTINFDDVMSLAWSSSLARVKVSNKANEIKKNDASFELHDQFAAAVQASYLVNMFDNYIADDEHAKKLENIAELDDVVSFIIGMLTAFKIKLHYDPDEEEDVEEYDDLYIYCQVSFHLRLGGDKAFVTYIHE